MDPLLIQGIIICAIGGAIYTAFMIVIFVKARSGKLQSGMKPKSRQADRYWLEEDGRPSRHGPGPSKSLTQPQVSTISALPSDKPSEPRAEPTTVKVQSP